MTDDELRLQMDIAGAVRVLEDRIRKGQRILARSTWNEGILQAASAEYRTWDEYNADMLGRMFSGDKLAQEYEEPTRRVFSLPSSLRDRLDWFVDKVEEKVRRLQSVLERLELYSDEPTRSEGLEEHLEPADSSRDVFIIHGHDREAALELKQLLKEKADIDAVLMDQKPHSGRTLIEKFEAESEDCGFAIAVLTPDDVVRPEEGRDYPQMRPNVVFELGWFYGRLGRDRTCILYKAPTEIPTDLEGIGYYPFGHNVREAWADIEEELQRAEVIEE